VPAYLRRVLRTLIGWPTQSLAGHDSCLNVIAIAVGASDRPLNPDMLPDFICRDVDEVQGENGRTPARGACRSQRRKAAVRLERTWPEFDETLSQSLLRAKDGLPRLATSRSRQGRRQHISFITAWR
jgi:hypothetical protein